MSASWLTVFSLGMVAVMSPGPDFALTLRNSVFLTYFYAQRATIFTLLALISVNSVSLW